MPPAVALELLDSSSHQDTPFLREVEPPLEIVQPRVVLKTKTRAAFASIYKVCDAFIAAGADESLRRDLTRLTDGYNSSVGEIHSALERLAVGSEHKLACKLYHRVAHSFESGFWWVRLDPIRLSDIARGIKARWEEIEALLAGQCLLLIEGVQ